MMKDEEITKKQVTVEYKVIIGGTSYSSHIVVPYEGTIRVQDIGELEALEAMFANIIEKAKETVVTNAQT